MPEDKVLIISRVCILTFMALSSVVILFSKNMKFWKVVALIACNIILGFGVSTQYLPVYIVLPVIFFLMAEKEMTKNNRFYLVCFVIVLALIPSFSESMESVLVAVRTIVILAASIAIISEGFRDIRRTRNGRNSSSNGVSPNAH
jgi:MFS family permease